jgi:large subunit ribosomal protein L24
MSLMIGNKCHIKKEDKVKILIGKDRGKIGKVLKVDRKKNLLLVENMNVVKRHTKPTAANKQGGIVEKEAPLKWSNVMLMCNKCMKPGRIKMKILEDGKKMRVCRKCGEDMDS